ncbi:MAG TPA: hypothetical protein VM093_03360 [Aeromicrobium sp.]|nr:hypothetical protein [Aeromicrobium sp.]
MGGSWLRRVRGALGARSRKEKVAGLAALVLAISAPFGGLERAADKPPGSVAATTPMSIGPYRVTFLRAYRVKQYLGAELQPSDASPVKPSSTSRRLLVLEVDVVNDGKRPEYPNVLTKAVSIAGAVKTDSYSGPSAQPQLVYRADGSRPDPLGPGLTHRLALIVEQPASAHGSRAKVSVSRVTYVGKGGLASNLDEDYWLVLDEIARRGTIPIDSAPAAVTR